MQPEKSTMENQVYHLPVKDKQNMVYPPLFWKASLKQQMLG